MIHKYKCKACRLHKVRRKIVWGRGSMPADILFMGEAPGGSEDLRGQPFIGMSGKLLDSMLEEAGVQDSYYIVNTVLCHPTNKKGGANREPKEDEVLACAFNVMKVYKAVKPKIVIFIGKVAEKYYGREFPITDSIQHPAFLLRTGGKGSPHYIPNIRKLKEIIGRINES